MFCAISGVTPEEPVVSVKSGLLYERRLIEKYIAETGQCPVTGDVLTSQDLVVIKSNKAVKPRPLQAASVPGMLALFQNEWDSLMLRDYQLEQQLNTVREELSYSLFQSDAAARVIGRLMRERDEARQTVAVIQRELAAAGGGGAGQMQGGAAVANGKRGLTKEEEEAEAEAERAAKRARQGITDDIIAELTECNAKLSGQRKKRQISPNLFSPEALEKFTQVSSHPLHKTTKPGILGLDIHPTKDMVVTGGFDGAAVVLDRASSQVTATLSGHSKRITSVKFVPRDELLLTASADKTVRIWKGQDDGSYECKHILRDHTGEVKALTLHATNNYFVSVSLDKTWGFYELNTGVCLTQVSDPSVTEGYTSASFHPDGLILGTGTAESLVRIWDVKSQTNVAKFEGHTGSVTSITFSENGYFLATAAADGVKLWDLRKLRNFRTISPYEDSVPTNSVEFDFSGNYLAIAGSDVRVYQVGTVKTDWNTVKIFPDLSGTGKVTAAKFGPDSSYLAVATTDRNLRIFGPPPISEAV